MSNTDLDDDLDVLGSIKAKALTSRKVFEIPVGAPVLPSIVSGDRDAELVVNADGLAMVLYNQPLQEAIEWAEYDMDLEILTFVTWEGKVQGLGMKVHKPFRRYLARAQEIVMIYMEDASRPREIYPAKLVVRNIGY